MDDCLQDVVAFEPAADVALSGVNDGQTAEVVARAVVELRMTVEVKVVVHRVRVVVMSVAAGVVVCVVDHIVEVVARVGNWCGAWGWGDDERGAYGHAGFAGQVLESTGCGGDEEK